MGWPWLAELAHAAQALAEVGDDDCSGHDPVAVAGRVATRRRHEDDNWGAGLASLAEGWGLLRRGDASGATLAFNCADAAFSSVNARTLEAWAKALAALAQRGGHGGANARSAEVLARTVAAPGAEAIALLASATAGEGTAAHAFALAADCGFRLPPTPLASSAQAWIEVRCFGEFEVRVEGRRIDLSDVKPRARSLLRLLASAGGRPIHREHLVNALWPDADLECGLRNLHVALSSLRQRLAKMHVDAATALVRCGESYALDVGPDGFFDVAEFEHFIDRSADSTVEAADLDRALRLYRGELLDDEGPAEWVTARREQMRHRAGRAATTLAERALSRNENERAAMRCEQGLAIDRYNDRLWQIYETALLRSGRPVAAAKVRSEYSALLAELAV
jgi:DNA-binding SARP family transcriptional activator